MRDGILVLRHRLDWRQIIQDLRAAGCTAYRMTSIMLIERSTVQRWQKGSEPRHSYGVAILEVHTHFCGAELTQRRLAESRLV